MTFSPSHTQQSKVPVLVWPRASILKNPLRKQTDRKIQSRVRFHSSQDTLIGMKTTVSKGSESFYDFLSLMYIPKLLNLKFLEAKHLFVPRSLQEKMQSFEDIRRHLMEEVGKIDFYQKPIHPLDSCFEDLLFLNKALSSFEITESDLSIILEPTPFYNHQSAVNFVRKKAQEFIMSFVENVKKDIQEILHIKKVNRLFYEISKDCHHHLRTLPDSNFSIESENKAGELTESLILCYSKKILQVFSLNRIGEALPFMSRLNKFLFKSILLEKARRKILPPPENPATKSPLEERKLGTPNSY